MAEEEIKPKKKTVRKPQAPKAKAEIEEEFISVEIASEQSRFYKQYNFVDYNPDELVQKKGLKVYQKMLSDEQVKACLMTKKLARLSTKWEVKPGDEKNAKSVEVAKFCDYVLRNMKTSLGGSFTKDSDKTGIKTQNTLSWASGSFTGVLYRIMSGLEYGFSLTEKVWGYYDDGPHKGKLGLIAAKTKEPFNYDFETDRFGNISGIIPPGKPYDGTNTRMRGDALPPNKFIIWSYNQEFSNWYGNSDLKPAYRPWWSKDMTIKWNNIYLERFGMPTVVIKYPAKGRIKQEILTDIDDILLNLQAKSGFRMPDNFTAEFLEAKRAGEAGYIKSIEKHDQAISRSILIPNKLGFGDDQSGSYALGKKHFDLFLFVLENLGNELSENVVDEQILRPLVTYNFGEMDEELMPYFCFESLLGVEQEPRANVLKALKDGGFVDPREDWVREYMELPARDLKKYPHFTPEGQPTAPIIPGAGLGGQQGEDDEEEPIPGKKPAPGKPKEEPKEEKKEYKDDGMTPKRAPTKFEKKVNFKRVEEGMTAMTDGLRESLQEVIQDVRGDVMKRAQKIFDSQDQKQVREMQVYGMKPFRETLRNWLVKAHLDSKLGQLEELGRTGDFEVEVKRKFSAIFAQQEIPFEPWEPIPPTEAIDLFNRKVLAKVVVTGGKSIEKTLIPLGRGAEMKYYDERAFYVAGVEEAYILDKTKAILLNGIEKGWSQRKMTEEMNDLFEKYLAKGVLRDAVLVTPARLETIVRTNLTEAYNRGRKAMIEHPVIKDRIPYVTWSAILDGRTTEYCEQMDGKVFRAGEVEAPPAHFNCRSVIVPITTAEVEYDGGQIEVTTQADAEGKAKRPQGFKCEHHQEA